jgi:DNA topoisomerase-1
MSPASKSTRPTGGRRLVIVESPAKARTIAGYLGRGYAVESSIGHIRDLPQGASEIPEKYRKEPWARLGVDIDNGFQPLYVVPADKKAQIRKLKSLLADSDELLLATDEDREGEAIAWHLLDELKPKVPVHRMVFHEITRDAILAAVENPRDIDEQLVDAQETRRILDRLYGYEVSPVLWKKVMPRLSAGRVQSVATRLVVDRERERIAFRAASYWDLEATFDAGTAGTGIFGSGTGDNGGRDAEQRTFAARLATVDGARVAQGRDFGSDGQLTTRTQVRHLDEPTARALADGLTGAEFEVSSVDSKPYRRSPYAPFRTTTLQQEAARKLGFGAKRTMQVAQRLYENGYITYMRTDSTTLSQSAINAARNQVRDLYGADYLPDAPRSYESKVKNAQEAHEAIRPSGDAFRTPAEVGLNGDEFRLYELIWMRTVASQMRDAVGRSVSVRVAGAAADGTSVEFAASGKVITFHGFLKAYVEGTDDPDGELDDRERRLPNVNVGDRVIAQSLSAEDHSTKAPARYTEATLVKELEEREIGRPSTYASIIGTILDRGYVFKRGTALVPTWLAFAVTRLLELQFGTLIDYDFTARLEDTLDSIAAGRDDRVARLREFYFGAEGWQGLHRLVNELGDIDARELNTFPIGESGVVLRVGRYGPYVERDGDRASVPEDLPPDELTAEYAEELLAAPSGDRVLGPHPETGHEIVAKVGRYGPYVAEVLPTDEVPTTKKSAAPKPRTASLFKSMSVDTVTLDQAVALLTLPRDVGADPESGEMITAQNGRYGPYLKRGTDSRSIDSEEDLLTIGLDEALQIYAQPKQHGRRAAAAPIRELGADPVSERPVVVREGRFGPYVTDGETNATLRKDDDPATITMERAAELLADKRARGPAPKRARTAKKTTGAKKTAAKKTTGAKKTAAKKTVAKATTAKKATAKTTTVKRAATT